MEARREGHNWIRLASLVAAVALTLLPIVNIVWIVATTGANSLGDEYAFMTGFIDEVLNGRFHWPDLLYRTFFDGHSEVFPWLIEAASAYLTHWNAYVALYIGIAVAALTLWLFHDAFVVLTPHRRGLWLWPILGALVFSVSQISVYTHGFAALNFYLAHFGFALGVWSLVRFRGRWQGVGLMVAGGVIAGWSSAQGLAAWAAFLVGLALLGYHKARDYAGWLLGASLAASPYVMFMVVSTYVDPLGAPLHIDPIGAPLGALFRYRLVINALGRAFANRTTSNVGLMAGAEWAGWIGVGLCLVGLAALTLRRNRRLIGQVAGPMMAITYGLLGCWMVSIGRRHLAPWHATVAMPFWVGLAGLAYVLVADWATNLRKGDKRSRLALVTPIWGIGVLLALTGLYLATNLTYMDKVTHLDSRSPASAACLRQYRTAPTYCQSTFLGLGAAGQPKYLTGLAWPLERNRLSVFSPHQQWTLQGDYILDGVGIEQSPDVPAVAWYTGLNGERASWSDYRHLSVLVHAPNAVTWAIELPDDSRQAEFRSAVGISRLAPAYPDEDGVTCEVYVEPAGGERQLVFSQHVAAGEHAWTPFSIPLAQFKGRAISLHLTTQAGANARGDWAMYRYPVIDLTLDQSAPVKLAEPVIVPANTELSAAFPRPTEDDLRLDGMDQSLWATNDLQPVPGSLGTWVAGTVDPIFLLKKPLDVCLADYTHFRVRLAVSPDVRPRLFQIYYLLDDRSVFSEDRSVLIPMLADGEVHSYTYPLKLLEPLVQPDTRLVGVRLDPVWDVGDNEDEPGERRVVFAELGLVRGEGDSRCRADIPAETIVGELTAGVEVSQSFVPDCQGLSRIELFTATYMRVNTYPVIARLTDVATGQVVAEQSIRGETVPDNGWQTIQIDPVAQSLGRLHRFTLTSPDGVPGNAITIYRSLGDAYPEGEALVDGVPINADLTFRHGCSP